ncbi:MAG: ROK family protein [Planctomycetota bacterium]|jgi:glucokinase
MAKYCIGIDLGGTYIKFALLDESHHPTETLQVPTAGNPDEIIADMLAGSKEILETNKVSMGDVVGAGIGSPGPINRKEGIVVAPPNVPSMSGVPLRDRVSDGLGVPAVLENDANTAAYGEYLCGAGEGTDDMVLLTFGTGVGSGVIINGQILHGAHEAGGEVGHIVIEPDGEQCGCGQKGCLERYCSATYIAQRAMRVIREENRSGLLADRLRANGSIDAQDIQETAREGDAFAAEVWDRCAYYIALGCVNVARIFDPDEIVLGGGMAKAGEYLLGAVTEHFQKLNWSLTDEVARITLAKLGNDAGAIGAAGVAWNALEKE